MSQTAFALREDLAGTVEIDGEQVPVFQGGVLALPNGNGSIDVGAELEANQGVILVEDHDQALVEILRSYPALKVTTDVPEGAVAFGAYEARGQAALREEAQRRGFEKFGGLKKADLAAALRAHDEAVRAGDTARAGEITQDPAAAAAGDTGDDQDGEG